MWALKRKLFIILVFIILLAIGAFFFYQVFIKKTPNCFDGIKNGLEEGVDCGGKCVEICKLRATKVNTLWAKTFEVSDGVSNVAALVENPNFDFNMKATYNIKTFDSKGVRVNDFKKEISLKPGEKRLIFIPSIFTGKTKITRTFIAFDNIQSLTKGTPEKKELFVTSKTIQKEDGQTRLTIGIKNKGLTPKRNTEVVAILYNKKGEVVDVAKTFIEYLSKREEKKVEMTWPKDIDVENMRFDVYLRKVEL